MDNKIIKQEFKVPFEYSVYFSRKVFFPDNPIISNVVCNKEKHRSHRIWFVLEESVAVKHEGICHKIEAYCSKNKESIDLVSSPHIMQGGEDLKSFDVIEDLCAMIAKHNLCRQSFIAIVGGGAFLDTVGFAASIVHRGIRQIRFPTTVLGQNDSGVGVKNGINMFGKKNFIGTFSPPFAIINDFDFIKTLEDRDWIAGIAEAFKVALIKDASFFDWLCANVEGLAERDASLIEYLIYRCAELHLEHIRTNGDPFEFGSARPLDFGHWIAHKLEMMSEGSIRHGEAVAVGIVMDSYYAVQAGYLDQSVLEKLTVSLRRLGFELWSDYFDSVDNKGRRIIFDGIEEFREHLGGELHVTLPDGIGNKLEVSEINQEFCLAGINYLRNLLQSSE